jgi:hypothetical protein
LLWNCSVPILASTPPTCLKFCIALTLCKGMFQLGYECVFPHSFSSSVTVFFDNQRKISLKKKT